MAWPTDAWTTGSLVFSSQMNAMPVLIASSTLGADAASIDFTGIPSHYAHLRLECYLRTSEAVAASSIWARFNNDSGANYDYQYLRGLAAGVSAAESFGATRMAIGIASANTADANLFGFVNFDIPHYANALNNKSALSRTGQKSGTVSGKVEVWRFAGFWRSNTAINQVTILPNANNFKSGSRASLYGLA